jgi:hypothetical protein
MGTHHYIFPLAFAMNTFSMTGFMVILGLSGKPSIAADFGIVQGATMALFYAFSANARNLILNPSSKTSVRWLLISRLALTLPLGAASFFLGVNLGGAYWPLALILILRRSTEWIAELHLSEMEFREGRSFGAQRREVGPYLPSLWLYGHYWGSRIRFQTSSLTSRG